MFTNFTGTVIDNFNGSYTVNFEIQRYQLFYCVFYKVTQVSLVVLWCKKQQQKLLVFFRIFRQQWRNGDDKSG